jgi:hypothetical protein
MKEEKINSLFLFLFETEIKVAVGVSVLHKMLCGKSRF